MSFEEVIKNPIVNYLIGALIFVTQLLLRSKLDEIKKQDEKRSNEIKELYKRTDEIPVLEKDLQNLRAECLRKHRGK